MVQHQRYGVGGVTETCLALREDVLQPGNRERIADLFTFQRRRGLSEMIAQDGAERLLFLLFGTGVEILENRGEQFDPLVHLLESALG